MQLVETALKVVNCRGALCEIEREVEGELCFGEDQRTRAGGFSGWWIREEAGGEFSHQPSVWQLDCGCGGWDDLRGIIRRGQVREGGTGCGGWDVGHY